MLKICNNTASAQGLNKFVNFTASESSIHSFRIFL